jgi:hypothetical protein
VHVWDASILLNFLEENEHILATQTARWPEPDYVDQAQFLFHATECKSSMCVEPSACLHTVAFLLSLHDGFSIYNHSNLFQDKST